MRILLIGEYSNVHWTLARGLRQLGHEVTVASNGDFWKDYPRDLDLTRRTGKLGGLALMAKVATLLPRWRGYDVVQLINPMFIELKAERIMPVYRYLRRHNHAIVLGAFGMDYYWVSECMEHRPLRYSDFNIGQELRTDDIAMTNRRDWIGTPKGNLNKVIAHDCDAIVTGLYEYDVCYRPNFPEKTWFIPFPIEAPPLGAPPPSPSPGRGVYRLNVENGAPTVTSNQQDPNLRNPNQQDPNLRNSNQQDLNLRNSNQQDYILPSQGRGWGEGPLRLFIGISRGRSVYKGTDIMLRAAQAVKAKYPDRLELTVAEGVPFSQYEQMMNSADAIMDQLYSYTPAMNALLAMSKGIVVIGGGEPENYDILGEQQLRPIVNVQPTEASVYHELEQLVLHPERLPVLKEQSIAYVRKHHDYLKVARQYEQLYQKIIAAAPPQEGEKLLF